MHKTLLLALALTACQSNDPEMGLAVQRNMVAHAVNLDPVYAGTPMEGTNGKRGSDAVNRYLNGAVTLPNTTLNAALGSGTGAVNPNPAPPPQN